MSGQDHEGIARELRKQFYCRRMEWKDLPEMEAMNKTYHFEYGLQNLSVSFVECDDLAEVIIDKTTEKIVCYTMSFRMSNGKPYGFKLLVDKPYRHKRVTYLGSLFFRHYGNTRGPTITQFSFKDHAFSFKLLIFNGIPKLPFRGSRVEGHRKTSSKVSVIEASEEAELAVQYDLTVISDIDRQRYIREWVHPKKFPVECFTVIAKSGSTVTGYATLRRGWRTTGWLLSPVYADNPSDAVNMIEVLLDNVKPNEEINFACFANSRMMLSLARELRLKCEVPLYHCHPYEYGELRYAYEKVHCSIQAWPM